MEKKDWREELEILLQWEEEEILLAERVAKPYSGKRREDIYNFVDQEIEKAREEGKKEERTSILERLEELREVELNGEGLFSLDFVIKVIRKLKSGSKCEMETLPYFRMELWVGEEKFACQSFIDSQEIKDMYYKDMVIEKMRRDFEKMIRATDEYLLSKLKDSK